MIKMLRAGDSDGYPSTAQSVAVHYDAYLPDGKLWDSSRKRGRPLRFRLGVGQVIPGLDEGVAQVCLACLPVLVRSHPLRRVPCVHVGS